MLQSARDQGRQQELLAAAGMILIAIVGILLFVQGKMVSYIIAFLVIGVVLFAQVNPRRWLYLSIILIPSSPSFPIYKLPVGPVTSELSDIVVMLALLVLIANILMGRMKRKGYDAYVANPLLVYCGITAMTSVLAYYTHYREFLVINSLGHLLKWTSYALLFIVAFKTMETEQDIKNLLRAILIAFSIGSLISIFGYMTHTAVADRLFRASGLVEGINAYGMLLAIILLFFFNLILQGKIRQILPVWLAMSAWSIMLIALILTFSRTAWACLGLGIIITSFIRGRRYIAVFFIAFTLIVFFLMGMPVELRVEQTFEAQPWSTLPIDLGGRETIWLTAIRRLSRAGVTGVGFNNFSAVIMGTTAHNAYLQVLAESGPLGFLAFSFFMYRLIKANSYLRRRHSSPFYKECAFGCSLIFFTALVASFGGEFITAPLILGLLLLFYSIPRVGFRVEIESLIKGKTSTFKPVPYLRPFSMSR